MAKRFGLTSKVVAVNVGLISVVLLIVYLSVEYLAADYFAALMSQYGIPPTDTHDMFLDAVHGALGWAALASIGGGVVVCFWLTRRILGPLSQMLRHTARVASGDYRSQIDVRSRDEVGELAHAFNEMARSLERVEGLRSRMVIDVAHELRTPLTSIQGYLEALRDGVLEPTDETLALVHEETETLGKLVEDVLQLARAEASTLRLEHQVVDLGSFVDELLEHYRERLAGCRVEVDIAPGETVWADPPKLNQILRNLLDNAEQHTPRKGRIEVRAEPRPGAIAVTVENTGEQVTGDQLGHIFERFYRVDPARSRERGGTGVGLAIVKELVVAHGGEVGARPCVDGMQVWFTLPSAPSRPRSRGAPAPSPLYEKA